MQFSGPTQDRIGPTHRRPTGKAPVQIVPEGRSQSGKAILPPQPQDPWKTALSSSLVLAKPSLAQSGYKAQSKGCCLGRQGKSGGPSRAISKKVGCCLLTATHQSEGPASDHGRGEAFRASLADQSKKRQVWDGSYPNR